MNALKSNTIQFSLAVMALGLLDQFSNVIPLIVPDEYRGIAVAGVGLAMAVLRWKTTVPLKDK